MEIVEGAWYLSSFVACQQANSKPAEFEYYGVPFYLGSVLAYTSSSVYDLRQTAFDVGAAMQTTMPIKLSPPAPTTSALTTLELTQLRQLLAGAATSAPFTSSIRI